MMNIVCILFGLLLIFMAIFMKPGRKRNGKYLCTGKIAAINDDTNTVTVRYICNKEEYFHEFTKNQVQLRYYSKGIKIGMWVDASDPQNVLNVLPGSNDYGVMYRLSLGLGLFFTIAGILIFMMDK